MEELPTGGREEETKRLARVLEIIQNIALAPHWWTRKKLAEKYEICERQIQRDLQIIQHRLKLDLRRDGDGYYFRTMPRLPTVSYSLSEALALLLAVQTARQFGVASAELASAIGRLESVFPDEFRPLLRGLPLADDLGSGDGANKWLLLLNRALAARRKVRLLYAVAQRGGEISERVVHPYCLLPYGRAWYLVGYCELRGEVRLLKVDRIQEAEVLPSQYRIPADFSLSQAPGAAWGLMWGAAGPEEEVRLLFNAEAGRWVAEEEWHSSQVVQQREDGRYLLTLRIGITPEFVKWLLFYGARVQVLAPEHLRREVAEEHRRAWEANE
ncbi:MAG: helix-turn-helix transcriptional regulator [Anaerolineae bacterium]